MQLLKVRSFSQVINDMFSFLKLNIKPLGQVMLFLVLPALLVSYFLLPNSEILSSLLSSTSATKSSFDVTRTALAYLGIFISQLFLSLSIIQLFDKYEESENGILERKDI